MKPESDDLGEGHDREPRRRRRGGRGRREDAVVDGQETAGEALTSAGNAAPAQPVQASLIEEAMNQAAAAAPATPAPAPVIETFTLPLDELNAIAAAAGLSWVNSDADKIAAAQAAIAAEPAPAPLGREPAPVVVVDEGPLVLVETRKDLSQVKLPFEA